MESKNLHHDRIALLKRFPRSTRLPLTDPHKRHRVKTEKTLDNLGTHDVNYNMPVNIDSNTSYEENWIRQTSFNKFFYVPQRFSSPKQGTAPSAFPHGFARSSPTNWLMFIGIITICRRRPRE